MFEFKGTAADSTEARGLDWRVVDHCNIQDLGRRPFTTMLHPARNQRTNSEGARRPSLPLRLRSTSSAPTYPRPQDRDDRVLPVPSEHGRTRRSSVDRQSFSGGSTHTRGETLDSFSPKAWIAKGSSFLKRQNSKQDLTSLRTLDWVEQSEQVHAHHGRGQHKPNRTRSTGSQTPAPRQLNISEPFNFYHVTHTQPHQAQKLEKANPNDLISEFSALRASQVSQPELRGIRAEDIRREDISQEHLLPDSPSQSRNGSRGVRPSRPARFRDLSLDTAHAAMSPARTVESWTTDDFSQPSAAYHTAQSSPMSPPHQTPCRDLTPDSFMFQHESAIDPTSEPPEPREFPEPEDHSTGTWNDGAYDLGIPHAVTTDDSADWNRQVPFSMVKTELAPVEEDDEIDDESDRKKRDSFRIRFWPSRFKVPKSGDRITKSFPSAKIALPQDSDACMPAAEDISGGSARPMLPAKESQCALSTRLLPVEEDVHGSPADNPEPSIEDLIDDIPVRSRLSRHTSVGLNDMERFWDLASDAINCSYALGAEADSFFDWYCSSIHEGEITVPAVDGIRTDAADTPSVAPPDRVQTFPQLAPPSAGSTESSPSSIPEAVAPYQTTESAIGIRFPHVNCKGWSHPAYIMSNDVEFQTAQDDLYQQLYTSDYPQDVPFPFPNLARIDGSTISNSPRSSQSPISKSSSQESFRVTHGATNTRRPRTAGSAGSLPELTSSKNSRERFEPAVDQLTDRLTFLTPSDSLSDSQQASTAQRRRSPNLAKDAAQNIMLSKVKTAEEPVPTASASRDRAVSDVTLLAPESSMSAPPPAAAGRRLRSGSSASSLNGRGGKGTYNLFPPPHTNPVGSS